MAALEGMGKLLVPLVTMLLLSIGLTVLLNVVFRLFR